MAVLVGAAVEMAVVESQGPFAVLQHLVKYCSHQLAAAKADAHGSDDPNKSAKGPVNNIYELLLLFLVLSVHVIE